MNLYWSTKNRITRNENGENVLYLKITEVALTLCNIVNKDYQQNSKVFHTFPPNNSFVQLLDISPKNLIFSRAFNSEFSYNEVHCVRYHNFIYFPDVEILWKDGVSA